MFNLKFGYSISAYACASLTCIALQSDSGRFGGTLRTNIRSTTDSASGNSETRAIPGQLALRVAFHFPCTSYYPD